jgi:hypothetical protein
MTTLGINFVHKGKDFIIYRSVSGDLSHGFQLVPASSYDGKMIGIGYTFSSKKDAQEWLKKAKKYGYGSQKFRNMYEKYRDKVKFGYLSFKEAKPYLREAYGEVADKYRKKLKGVM